MIAAWMFYCSLCALGLSLAAVLAERVLLAGRGPVRFIWVGAVGLSLLVPAAALRFASRPGPGDASADVSQNVPASRILDTAPDAPATEPGGLRTPGRNWRATLAALDQPLAVAWVVLSLALALNFFAGVAALASMRRRWVRRVVLDVPVFVTERTGPAVVGLVAPSIVLPEWVLSMEPQQLSLMLRHEQEHRRAGDGQLLTAAELALIAMPWNVALWWQILRLRVAVELDCDARVLRDADARSYANLLLEVARPRRGPSLMGAMAFAERATQLERRIRVLARHRARTTRVARAGATFIALLAVTAAWVAPRPAAPVPARPSSATPAVAAIPVGPNAAAPSSAGLTPMNALEIPVTNRTTRSGSPASTRTAGENSGLGAPVPPDSTLGRQGREGDAQGVQDPVDAIFRRLFDGITLTPDQETRAREILTGLQREQFAQDQVAAAVVLQNRARALTLQMQRDSALRGLLTNDADRAAFDANRSRRQGGGRRGGPPPDASTAGQRGGGRGGGGGRGDTLDALNALRQGRGRSGGSVELDGVALLTDTLLVDATYRRLFDGITLTPDQETSARALIASTQQEMRLQTMQREDEPLIIVDGIRFNGSVQLRMNPRSGLVSIRTPNDSLLIALVSNEDDRARLRSRIVSIPR